MGKMNKQGCKGQTIPISFLKLQQRKRLPVPVQYFAVIRSVQDGGFESKLSNLPG